MATTNLVYNKNGLAEDFENVVFNIDYTETPLLSLAKRKTATARLHQWQIDTLATAAHSPIVEGADATYATLAATTVLANQTQINAKYVDVSGTLEKVKKYGRDSEMTYQMIKKAKEWKRDFELSLIGSQVATAGVAASARAMAGLEAWIDSETGNTFYIGGSAAGSSAHTSTPWGAAGYPVTAITHGSTQTFTETSLKGALQMSWKDGGQASVIFMRPGNKDYFDAFAGVATKYNEVKGSTQGVIIGAADMYVSSYGNHTVMLHRDMSLDTVLCVDPRYISVAWLRPIQQEELAKVGDSRRRMIVGEGTLVVDNPYAHAKVVDCNASS